MRLTFWSLVSTPTVAQGDLRRRDARVAVEDAPDLRFAQPGFGSPIGIALIEPAVGVFGAFRPVEDLAEQDGGFVVAAKEADKAGRTEAERFVAVGLADQGEDVLAKAGGRLRLESHRIESLSVQVKAVERRWRESQPG